MPTIHFKNKSIPCKTGENLRKVLLRFKLSPYNGTAHYLNCTGFGTCGTCAVRITGPVSKMTRVERWRLNFPPHRLENGLRLACQCRVLGDIVVEKENGFWGSVGNE